jgi:hypothetical protein
VVAEMLKIFPENKFACRRPYLRDEQLQTLHFVGDAMTRFSREDFDKLSVGDLRHHFNAMKAVLPFFTSALQKIMDTPPKSSKASSNTMTSTDQGGPEHRFTILQPIMPTKDSMGGPAAPGGEESSSQANSQRSSKRPGTSSGLDTVDPTDLSLKPQKRAKTKRVRDPDNPESRAQYAAVTSNLMLGSYPQPPQLSTDRNDSQIEFPLGSNEQVSDYWSQHGPESSYVQHPDRTATLGGVTAYNSQDQPPNTSTHTAPQGRYLLPSELMKLKREAEACVTTASMQPERSASFMSPPSATQQSGSGFNSYIIGDGSFSNEFEDLAP